jgi:hypothetical protein
MRTLARSTTRFFGPAQVVPPFADDRFTAHVLARTQTANVGLADQF